MELDLRLGDAPSSPFGFSQKHPLNPKPNTTFLHQNDVVFPSFSSPPPSPPPSPLLIPLHLLPHPPPSAAAAAASRPSTSLTEAGDVITAAPPSATAAEGGGELGRNPLIVWSSLYGGGSAAAPAADGGGILEVEEGNCDDEEYENLGSRKKLRLSREQSEFLEHSFKQHHTLYPKQKLELARRLNLRPRQVEVWFQNRRARTKLKQTEIECEYLKKWCETLTQQNKKLRKELQDLTALKTTDSLTFMHSPPTTLTFCASCQRAAASSPSNSLSLPTNHY